MKSLWCGGRNFENEGLIETWMRKLCTPGKDIVIHGGASGADSCAGRVAQRLGLEVKVYPAQWDKHGRAAGPIRNQQMLDENPDIALVIAFPGNGKGTWDMISRAEKKGIYVIVGNASSDMAKLKETT